MTTDHEPGLVNLSGLDRARHATLASRQEQVLALMCADCSNQQIGDELHLAVPTIKTVVRQVFDKLGASSRPHAVALAFAAGLVHATEDAAA